MLFLIAVTGYTQQDTLFWSDEFNGSGPPDPATWSYDLGNNGWGNNEIQNYTDLTQNVRQENGLMVIDALKTGNTWTSARIISRNKFNFIYGRVAFSAKLPSGSGTWPALWMLGEEFSTLGWPACGEIDVMEFVGKNPGVIHSSIHTSSSFGNTVNTNTWFVDGCSSGFHTYEATWSPDKIEFRIDGYMFYSYEPVVKIGATWPFNKSFFLIMNIAMGGNFGSDPQYETNGLKNGIDPALTSARMEIDYVRVYKSIYPASIDDPQNFYDPGTQGKPIFSPNPAEEKIRIQSTGGHPLKGTISDISGKYIFSFQTERESDEIDISSLAKGCYFISVGNGRSIKTNKLIIK